MMHYLEMFFYYGILTALVLTIVVFVHEMGHYLMARRFGIKVDAFSIGFGRELVGFTDKRGMRWKICLFPFGGFVVLHGENPPYQNADQMFEAAERDGALWTRPNWQRALVSFGGPLANFIFTLLLMLFVFSFWGKGVVSPVISAVEIGAGADRAGIKVGDEILSIDGQSVPEQFDDVVRMTQESGDALDIEVKRGENILDFHVNLIVMKEDGDFGEDASRKIMGIVLGNGSWLLEAVNRVDDIETSGQPDLARQLIVDRLGRDMVVNFGLIKKPGDLQKNYRLHLSEDLNQGLFDPKSAQYDSIFYGDHIKMQTKKIGVGQSAVESLIFSWKAIRKTIGVIYQMGVGRKDAGDLGGVVKIGEMTGGAARQVDIWGYAVLLKLLAVLSVNIGFLNLLPLPMLDGGHLVFNLYEAVRGKAPHPKTKAYIMAGSLGFVFAFVILVNFRDILEIFY
ncbi:MAG: hypothetical protein AUJ12_05580 [Alphaproteobacteria bacterium CG1_02_46_17]|nr:MAG: hypothetical protein AUJ12_05580 [Alphaproteobacteria bacterium CG1_02_46_17]